MEDRDARARMFFQGVENLSGSPSAVYGKDSSSGAGAGAQDPVEHQLLITPMALEFRAAIEPYLADVTGRGKKLVEQREFAFPFVGKLGMEAESGSDARGIRSERRRPFKRGRRRRHREHIHLPRPDFPYDLDGVGIEVEVAVEVYHLTPSTTCSAVHPR